MSYADPQTVTINAIAKTLARTGSGLNVGSFATSDSTVKLGVSHQYGKRTRRSIRLDHSIYATDPANSALMVPRSMSTYLVIDLPLQGYDVTLAGQVVNGFTAYLTASSNAAVTKLLGGEN